MSLKEVKRLLQTSGSNTKGQLLDFFNKPTKKGLIELIKDLQEELRKLEAR